MVKPALAAARLLQVLDFLSVHPGQSFSLQEISHACGLNAASLLAIMTALVDGGYVLRHPSHKTYRIGPGVVALGRAALVEHPEIGAAQVELELLANELEVQCSASVLMGSDLVPIITAGRPRRAESWTYTGARVPFMAPFGAPFAAFGSDAVRDQWMQRAKRPADDTHLEVLERELTMVRKLGFAVLRQVPLVDMGMVLKVLTEEPSSQVAKARLGEVLERFSDQFLDLDAPSSVEHDVGVITVPVFSPIGDVVMTITANGFPDPLTVAQIAEIGGRLRGGAGAITISAYGSLGSGRAECGDAQQHRLKVRSPHSAPAADHALAAAASAICCS